MKNYYDILKIPPSSNHEEIIRQYRRQIKKFHLQQGGVVFKELVESYEVLSHPESRSIYNQRLSDYEDKLQLEEQQRLDELKAKTVERKKSSKGVAYLLMGHKGYKLRIVDRLKMAIKIMTIYMLGIGGCTLIPIASPIILLVMLISTFRYKKRFIGIINGLTCVITSVLMVGIIINVIGRSYPDKVIQEPVEITWQDQYIETEMIFVNSDTEYLGDDVLMTMSKEALGFARNELFAKHGLVFGKEPYKSYFESRSWYISNEEYKGSTDVFNEYEEYNLYLIMKYETVNE